MPSIQNPLCFIQLHAHKDRIRYIHRKNSGNPSIPIHTTPPATHPIALLFFFVLRLFVLFQISTAHGVMSVFWDVERGWWTGAAGYPFSFLHSFLPSFVEQRTKATYRDGRQRTEEEKNRGTKEKKRPSTALNVPFMSNSGSNPFHSWMIIRASKQ